jgi:hypothetical protein
MVFSITSDRIILKDFSLYENYQIFLTNDPFAQ